MFESVRDLDLDQLRAKHSRLYYFGLGFIQLKIDETWRLHFYSPELPVVTEDIHDHRYDFESRVLAGTITNTFYRVASRPRMWLKVATPAERQGLHVMRPESCNPDVQAPATETLCEVVVSTVETFSKGDTNEVEHTEFHRVFSGDCITLLRRGPYKKDYANVVMPLSKIPVCPFSVKIPEDDLWACMERMIERHR